MSLRPQKPKTGGWLSSVFNLFKSKRRVDLVIQQGDKAKPSDIARAVLQYVLRYAREKTKRSDLDLATITGEELTDAFDEWVTKRTVGVDEDAMRKIVEGLKKLEAAYPAKSPERINIEYLRMHILSDYLGEAPPELQPLPEEGEEILGDEESGGELL